MGSLIRCCFMFEQWGFHYDMWYREGSIERQDSFIVSLNKGGFSQILIKHGIYMQRITRSNLACRSTLLPEIPDSCIAVITACGYKMTWTWCTVHIPCDAIMRPIYVTCDVFCSCVPYLCDTWLWSAMWTGLKHGQFTQYCNTTERITCKSNWQGENFQ